MRSVNELVEELHAPKPTHKVEIRRRPDGNLQVRLYQWLEEDVSGHGRVVSFWSEIRTAASIVDTLETARAIARDLLRRHAPVLE